MHLSWKVIIITNLLMVQVYISEMSGIQKITTCCREILRSVMTDPIISYELHYPDPPCVKAVILETETGKFCNRWTKSSVWKTICNFETNGKSICVNQARSWALEKFPTFLGKNKQLSARVVQNMTSTQHHHHHPSSIKNFTHVEGSA